MGFTTNALKTRSTEDLNTLAEQFGAAMLIARKGSRAFHDAARAKSCVESALMYRRIEL